MPSPTQDAKCRRSCVRCRTIGSEIRLMKSRARLTVFLKAVYGPVLWILAPPQCRLDQLLIEKKQILERWAEHFDSVLNCPASVNNEASGKAPGSDAIPAEVFKAGGPVMIQKLTQLFQSIWRKENVPQQFKDATIVHIYKRKGNRQSCDNYRGLSLLCITGKILTCVLLNHLLQHFEQGHLDSQCSFCAERGTSDMIFYAPQLQEKCQEQHCNLYMSFVHLTKAFETGSRDGLWKVMEKFGCPSILVCHFHDGMMVKVLDRDELDTFPVTNGMKNNCVLAPTLFSMMFSALLTDAFQARDDGILIRYRMDGRLFNLRRLQAVKKVKEIVVRDLLFADDCLLNAKTEQQMQNEMDCLSVACDNFDFTISTKKTEIMYQPAPRKPYHSPMSQSKERSYKQ
ncbi:hypothetical protein RRG08_065165 [Elysia crispata]|uniref:Reverse transcriptase domain-containing protein n=1 Tax=Elysia crispata TaxID=231223 RepID=A0AAE1D8L6_9GAST|nr:hypothetical protein RRG08_065165 [Elysia crispata]